MKNNNCSCCGSIDITILKFNISKCSNCGHRRKEIFDIQDYNSKNNRNNRRSHIAKKNKERLNFIESYDFKSVIDVGCAEGYFGKYLKENLKLERVDGVELSEDYELAVLNLDNVYNSEINKINFNYQYDFLTLFHVVEHVYDLKTFLNDCLNVTQKYICIEVPYNSGNDLIDFDLNNEHIHFFSCASLIVLLESLNVKIIKLQTGGFESPRYNNCIRILAKKVVDENFSILDIIIEKCGDSFFVYGAGGNFKSILNQIEGINSHIIGVVDKNQKLSLEIDNFLDVSEILLSEENILISSIDYFEEIKQELIEMGVSEKRIIGIECILNN